MVVWLDHKWKVDQNGPVPVQPGYWTRGSIGPKRQDAVGGLPAFLGLPGDAGERREIFTQVCL